MTQPKMIAAYIHCRECVKEGRPTRLEIGITGDGAGVQIWCAIHDTHVGMLALREPITGMLCGECGQPLGGDHKHEHEHEH